MKLKTRFACGAGSDTQRRSQLELLLLCSATRPSLFCIDNIYPRQGFFCVSSVHTHVRDLFEWNLIIRDIVIKPLLEVVFINMEENDEAAANFISNLLVQL